jgi:hypothetical protein
MKIIENKIKRSGKGKSKTEEVVQHTETEVLDVQDVKPVEVLESEDTFLIPKPIPEDEAFKLFNLINEGYDEAELRTMFPTWPTRKFNALFARAKELVTLSVQDTEKEKAAVVAKYKHLYKLAMSTNNAKEARQILDSMTKVLGLTKDITVNDGTFVAVWR